MIFSCAEYRFLGWYKDRVRYSFTQPVTDDITLTAKWASEDETFIELSADSCTLSNFNRIGTVYLASYNANGALMNIKTVQIMPPVEIQSISAEVAEGSVIYFKKHGFETEGAAKISAFLWDVSMTDLCESDSISLN